MTAPRQSRLAATQGLETGLATGQHHDSVINPTGTGAGPRAGQPRDQRAAAGIAKYNRRVEIPLVLSALLPLVIVPQPGSPFAVAIGILSWLVFVVDFVVHERLLVHYLGTGLGRFDLAIVVLTAPWFLLPGASTGGLVVVLRLARLARLIVASKGARQLLDRLGRAAVVAGSVLVVGATAAYYAEHVVNPEFADFGDSLWWAVVTMTTVGYGDITPITTAGRLTGVMIMFTGVGVLGVLAGTLASFFRLQPNPSAANPPPADPGPTSKSIPATAPAVGTNPQAALAHVLVELGQLRAEVGEISEMTTQIARLHANPQTDNPGVGDGRAIK